MSFLDSLENNLKALEEREKELEAVPDANAGAARRDAAARTAPHAEALKQSSFAGALIVASRVQGRSRRIPIRTAWIGSSLCIESGAHRLELEPGPDGVHALYREGVHTSKREPVKLDGDAAALAAKWLDSLPRDEDDEDEDDQELE